MRIDAKRLTSRAQLGILEIHRTLFRTKRKKKIPVAQLRIKLLNKKITRVIVRSNEIHAIAKTVFLQGILADISENACTNMPVGISHPRKPVAVRGKPKRSNAFGIRLAHCPLNPIFHTVGKSFEKAPVFLRIYTGRP